MPFTFSSCPIQGLVEIQPKVFADNRGYFLESYSRRDFEAAGIHANFVQDNQSRSVKGVLRGLHFQKTHPQGKLVRAVEGTLYDIAVDLRKGSATFGKYHGVILSSEKQNQFYVPEGFAHGFLVLSETAVFAYKCTDFYYPEDEAGLMWNDPLIGIEWDKAAPDINPLLAEKDTKYPLFNKEKNYFDINAKWIGE